MLKGGALFSTQVIDCARTNSQSKKQNIKLPNDLAAQPLTGLGTAIVFICGMFRFADIMSSKLKAGKIPAVKNVACILVPRVHLCVYVPIDFEQTNERTQTQNIKRC